jgi:hypothetical protein
MTARPDLLSLTADALAAMANRGLVKRAAKEPPAVLEVVGDTIRARFDDGVTTVLPPGALNSASCSCGAVGMCRHRVAVVLAYQGSRSAPAFAPWSPGDVDDSTLARLCGTRAITAARRVWRAGHPVTVRRPTAGEVATVELPSCTVRFLVPGELRHVRTDAVAANRDMFVVLAVWAFREADARGLTADVVQFDVGENAPDGNALRTALDLVDQLLLDGVAHTTPILAAALRNTASRLTGERLHWPAAAVEDLVDQLAVHQARGARYHSERVAELITELHARDRATGPRSQVLGGDESGETPLRLVRLIALGCRVHGETAEVFFAADGIVLVLRQDISRRVNGVPLSRLAVSNVVSESAIRTASRVVRLSSNRVAKTTITPIGAGWESLPESILVRDYAAMAASLGDLPPRVVRARVEAEFVQVLEIAEVKEVTYHPGDQRLAAIVADAHGTTAMISAIYRSSRPGALDALAKALANEPRFVSGSLRREHGWLVIDPIAVQARPGVVVPDMAAGEYEPLGPVPMPATDPIRSAVDSSLSAYGLVAHHGLNRIPAGVRTALDIAAADLHRIGMRATATHIKAFIAEPTVETWFASHIRLLTLLAGISTSFDKRSL